MYVHWSRVNVSGYKITLAEPSESSVCLLDIIHPVHLGLINDYNERVGKLTGMTLQNKPTDTLTARSNERWNCGRGLSVHSKMVSYTQGTELLCEEYQTSSESRLRAKQEMTQATIKHKDTSTSCFSTSCKHTGLFLTRHSTETRRCFPFIRSVIGHCKDHDSVCVCVNLSSL